MAWSTSKIFRPFIADMLQNTVAFDLDTDQAWCALYDNDITPDTNVTAALSAYNAGQWVSTGNECYEAGTWPAGGVQISSPAISTGTDYVMYDTATDTASTSGCDLTNVYGCLVYDETVATVDDQGLCFNYFNGPNSVTNGTFTVVWHANGIFRITL